MSIREENHWYEFFFCKRYGARHSIAFPTDTVLFLFVVAVCFQSHSLLSVWTSAQNIQFGSFHTKMCGRANIHTVLCCVFYWLMVTCHIALNICRPEHMAYMRHRVNGKFSRMSLASRIDNSFSINECTLLCSTKNGRQLLHITHRHRNTIISEHETSWLFFFFYIFQSSRLGRYSLLLWVCCCFWVTPWLTDEPKKKLCILVQTCQFGVSRSLNICR